MADIGFEKFDINIMIIKGIASLDKQLVIEQLADLHKDVKVRMIKDKQRLEEIARKKQEMQAI